MLPEILTERRQARLRTRETALSRRYLRVLEKWIPVGLEYFEDWPGRPNCGHFLGGCHWYGIETVSGSLAFALAASSPEYDERRGGCSREELRRTALKGIRYLCFTHDAGPADCVRPEKGLGRPENCGTKWGERGLGFFKESQCGTTVAGMGLVALLLEDLVDEETWQLLVDVHLDYAGRFGEMAPKSGVYYDTQMEENGWTSCGLAGVECLLERAPEAEVWAQTARQWMFSTATTPQDNKDKGMFVEGKTVANLTGRTFTALPDYMAENHGWVHPNYTGSSVNFCGQLGVIYGAFGRKLPEHALFNRQKVYNQLKLTTDRMGAMHPVQGMDWPYLFPYPGHGSHAAAATLLGDADGARLERWALATLEGRQAGNDGRMFDRDIAESVHDVQDPLIVRESAIAGPAYTYLLHRIYGDGAKPVADEELEKGLRGVRVYPHSGFVFHRHRRGQTSFAWRNCPMVLPLNRDGIYTVAPASNSFLASVEVKGRPDSQEEVSLRVDAQDEGFAAALVMDRAQGSVRQEVLFAGLPDGRSLSWERLTAREGVTVEKVQQGFLRIVNEDFGGLAGNCNGFRKVYTPAGGERFEGFVDADSKSDVVRVYEHPGWASVDDRLGIVFRGTGETVYHNRHFFDPWWAVADDLILSRREKRFRVGKGEVVGELAALVAPDWSHRRMGGLRLVELRSRRRAVGLIVEGFLAAASFEEKGGKVGFAVARRELEEVPVFAGVVKIAGRRVNYSLALEGGEATLRKALLMLRVAGDVEVIAAETGEVVLRNVGEKGAVVEVGKGGERVRVGKGKVVVVR